jgi:hypothetical protein
LTAEDEFFNLDTNRYSKCIRCAVKLRGRRNSLRTSIYEILYPSSLVSAKYVIRFQITLISLQQPRNIVYFHCILDRSREAEVIVTKMSQSTFIIYTSNRNSRSRRSEIEPLCKRKQAPSKVALAVEIAKSEI